MSLRITIPMSFTSLTVVLTLLFISGCTINLDDDPPKEELLIYCGITMIQPMQEIADLFEARTDCIVKFIKGGSGNLYRSIKANSAGDLYLPGSESYINTAKSEELVTQTLVVGFNRAAILVKKGNPLAIQPDLKSLVDSRYRVALGAEDSGSIGRETARILRGSQLYDQAMKKALFLTTDSKDLTKAIMEDRVDLVVNWYATGLWPQHTPYVDVLRFNEEQVAPHRLVLGILTFSINRGLSRDFMALAGSEEGQAIFRKCGFGQ